MTFWTYQNLADVTQGHWLVAPDDPQAHVTGLWHDTREISKGQAYLAIKGDHFDGHDFLDQAFDAGAKLAIVQANPKSEIRNPKSPLLQVPDTVKALQDLARAYRDELKTGGCKVIGIAGSNGKTTTRHLIHHVLTHAGLQGTQSPKSFNNHLGVPLTLLSGKPQDDFIACEIGTNHPGEIDFLSAIVRPDIAVITSIGEEHLEFFKDLDGVMKEEFSIANHFDQSTLCIVGDSVQWRHSVLEQAVSRASKIEGDRMVLGKAFDPDHKPSQENAKLTSWVALSLGLSEDSIREALSTAHRPDGRWQRIMLGQGVLLIDDAYNANFSSTLAALDALDSIQSSRKVFVFGEMYELGDWSTSHHTMVGQDVACKGFDLFIAIGTLTKPAMVAASEEPNVDTAYFPEWSDDLPEKVTALLEPGDTVLLKASRGMRLERLIPAIERRFGPAERDRPT